MKLVSDSTKVVYLILMIVFIIIVGLFWMDYIGLINLGKIYHHYIVTEAPSVVDAADDEPSLIEREEFEKEKDKLLQRIEELDKREAKITEAEKVISKRCTESTIKLKRSLFSAPNSRSVTSIGKMPLSEYFLIDVRNRWRIIIDLPMPPIPTSRTLRECFANSSKVTLFIIVSSGTRRCRPGIRLIVLQTKNSSNERSSDV